MAATTQRSVTYGQKPRRSEGRTQRLTERTHTIEYYPSSRKKNLRALFTAADGVSTAWEDKGVEVIIKVGVPPEIKGRDVSFDVHAGRVTLQARGETLLSGDTEHAIDPDTSLWFLEEDEALGRSYALTRIPRALQNELDAMRDHRTTLLNRHRASAHVQDTTCAGSAASNPPHMNHRF